jgi:hypothetical protein
MMASLTLKVLPRPVRRASASRRFSIDCEGEWLA